MFAQTVAPVPVQHNVQLTMTQEEAQLLFELAGRNVTIPRFLNEEWGWDYDDFEQLLSSLRSALSAYR